MTVLFADVVHSMAIAAARGMERLREIMTELVERRRRWCTATAATVDKFTGEEGNTQKMPSSRHGKGLRWIARYVDDEGREQTKSFDRKVDAQRWLDKQVSDQVTGTWTDPALSAVSFGMMAQRWVSTKSTRAPKTVAGYRSLLDTVVLPRWKDVPLREVRFDDLQVWITDLSVDGSVRFEGNGLSASRVRQAHQLVGAVLKFAVKAKHLAVNPADGIELPRLPEAEQRYLTHEQLHRVAVASGRLRTLVFVLGYCGLRFGEASALRVADVDVSARRIRVRRSVAVCPQDRSGGRANEEPHGPHGAPCPRSSHGYLRPRSPTAMAERSYSSRRAAAGT